MGDRHSPFESAAWLTRFHMRESVEPVVAYNLVHDTINDKIARTGMKPTFVAVSPEVFRSFSVWSRQVAPGLPSWRVLTFISYMGVDVFPDSRLGVWQVG